MQVINGLIQDHAHAYDIVGQGCNCFNVQGGGISRVFSSLWSTNNPNVFTMESPDFKGNVWKLGNYEAQPIVMKTPFGPTQEVLVANMYTQYKPGPDAKYWAIQSCLYKINKDHPGKRILLPQIGSGIGGLNWDKVERIIKEELKDMYVTIIKYNPKSFHNGLLNTRHK